MWTGTIEFDILLGDVHSLKEKRSLVRPIVAARPEVELLASRRMLHSSDDG